jgi:hypothetical protein
MEISSVESIEFKYRAQPGEDDIKKVNEVPNCFGSLCNV